MQNNVEKLAGVPSPAGKVERMGVVQQLGERRWGARWVSEEEETTLKPHTINLNLDEPKVCTRGSQIYWSPGLFTTK